jgi:hypothetical protein
MQHNHQLFEKTLELIHLLLHDIITDSKTSDSGGGAAV